MNEQIKDSGFTGYVVSFSEVLRKDDIDIKLMDVQEVNENDNDEYNEQLYTILTKLPDETSRIDLIDQLRRKLLIAAAQKLNCNKIFQADSTMDIATKVLANICLGRSNQLSTLANFCDARYADIKILKPMRDFTQQELLYYSEFYKMDSIKLRESNVSAQTSSVQALAYNFTTGLESQFSGTLSTIFRTAEKLSVKGKEEQCVENNCVLCDTRLDFKSRDDEVSALRAIEISKLVSSESIEDKAAIKELFNLKRDEFGCKNSQTTDKECCNGNSNCATNDKRTKINMEDIWKCLCYSCRLIFRSSDIRSTLPESLLYTVEQRIALKNMRKEIDEFFL